MLIDRYPCYQNSTFIKIIRFYAEINKQIFLVNTFLVNKFPDDAKFVYFNFTFFLHNEAETKGHLSKIMFKA